MSLIEEVRSRNVAIHQASIGITCDPSHYIITPPDYRRYNSVDSSFNMKLYLPVLRAFDCRCAICGADSEGIEMDHFFLPKAQGGNYILTRAVDDAQVLNAVPLCISCNRRKSASSISAMNIPLDQMNVIITTVRDIMAAHLGCGYPTQEPAHILRLRADDAIPELMASQFTPRDVWDECVAYLKGEPNTLQERVDEMVGWEETLLLSGV